MDDLFEFGRRILKSHPFGALFSAEFEVFAPGAAVLALIVPAAHSTINKVNS
jgi:hypothetical protein